MVVADDGVAAVVVVKSVAAVGVEADTGCCEVVMGVVGFAAAGGCTSSKHLPASIGISCECFSFGNGV